MDIKQQSVALENTPGNRSILQPLKNMMNARVRTVLAVIANILAICVVLGAIFQSNTAATERKSSILTTNNPDYVSLLPVVGETDGRQLSKGKGSVPTCVPLYPTPAPTKGKGKGMMKKTKSGSGKGKGDMSAAPVRILLRIPPSKEDRMTKS